MLRMFRNSAAVIVASAALTLPALAQTTVPAVPAPAATPQPTAPAAGTQSTAPAPVATAPAAIEAAVPQALSDLGITSATVSQGPKGGQRVQGTLPDGTEYRAMLDPQGQLKFLGVADQTAALPDDVTRRLIPEPARNASVFAEFSSVKGVMPGDQRVMVVGVDAQGQMVRAGFSSDGVLQRFGRGDHDGPRMKNGDKGPGKDRGIGHGKGGKDHERGKKRHDDGPKESPMGGQGADSQAPQIDDGSVRSILTDGGYTQIGAISRNGPRIEAEATNPEGENVRVTINPRGIVVRELAR